jgi:hypothetical protein
MEDEDMGDDELGIASMKKRTRKQYDERRDLDDLDGIEDASRPLFFSTILILTHLCPGNSSRAIKRHKGQVHR